MSDSNSPRPGGTAGLSVSTAAMSHNMAKMLLRDEYDGAAAGSSGGGSPSSGSPSSSPRGGRPRSALKSGGTGSPRPSTGAAAAAHHAHFAVGSNGASDADCSRPLSGRKVSFDASRPPPSQDDKPRRHKDDASLKKIVHQMYQRVLSHAALKPFFDGIDMQRLEHQQEAFMMMVFGGSELIEAEMPGLLSDLRAIHLPLLHRGLDTSHWQAFADAFTATLDELDPPLPLEVKDRAVQYMAATKHHFRPLEPGEWPPKEPYQSRIASCPFAGASA